jgi:hypothetical protein
VKLYRGPHFAHRVFLTKLEGCDNTTKLLVHTLVWGRLVAGISVCEGAGVGVERRVRNVSIHKSLTHKKQYAYDTATSVLQHKILWRDVQGHVATVLTFMQIKRQNPKIQIPALNQVQLYFMVRQEVI